MAGITEATIASKRTETCLQTDRLRLRVWRDSDAAEFLRIYSDPDVCRFIRDAPVADLDEANETLSRIRSRMVDWPADCGYWACELPKTGELVGSAMLKPLPNTPHIEIGWHLGRWAWGQGLATEAAQGVLSYAHSLEWLHEVVAVVHPDNTASQRVARRLCMTDAGTISAYDMELCLFTKSVKPDGDL